MDNNTNIWLDDMIFAKPNKGANKTITIVNGNLMAANENIIGHQTNCRGVMGSGVAKQIREIYPKAFKEYMEFCRATPNLLGNCQLVKVAHDKYVANLFGQSDYGRNKNIVYTNYPALIESLTALKKFAQANNLSVALPYNIGCGFANGDWDGVVYPILEDIFL
jgi:O-acetyl-ADP-ribose deacetylase (regulator of RNase III)